MQLLAVDFLGFNARIHGQFIDKSHIDGAVDQQPFEIAGQPVLEFEAQTAIGGTEFTDHRQDDIVTPLSCRFCGS